MTLTVETLAALLGEKPSTMVSPREIAAWLLPQLGAGAPREALLGLTWKIEHLAALNDQEYRPSMSAHDMFLRNERILALVRELRDTITSPSAGSSSLVVGVGATERVEAAPPDGPWIAAQYDSVIWAVEMDDGEGTVQQHTPFTEAEAIAVRDALNRVAAVSGEGKEP